MTLLVVFSENLATFLPSTMHLHLHLNYLIPAVYLVMATATVVDCVKSNNQNKAGWIAVIVLVPFLGSLLYSAFAQGRVISEL